HFITHIMGGAKGVKMPRGDLEQIQNFQVPVPPNLNEQQKIADCLSSLDHLIRAEASRLEALKDHKKGLMQQLFPREGETTPRLRFPEFRDAGPWEVKRLGKLVRTVTPPAKLQTSEYLPSGQFPIIDQSPSDICGWTNDETAVVQGDFPFVVFGDHTCTVKLAVGPFAQGADGIKILAPTPEIDARFLFLALQADPIEQKGYKRHFSTLKEKLIPFPQKDTGEQQKIADCLSSLDDLIRAQGEKIKALKQHKKGLMQQIFPNDEL
ncbi:MAG TPA: restriction endonuclease subunit S, partial [Gammaproteobacteria bacterium]|nr:restriction endonuclease subunit S [Gammaproteobacteria bacterium]